MVRKYLLMLSLITVAGCTGQYYKVPTPEYDATKYDVVGKGTETSTGIMLFNFIPINENELFDEKCVPKIAVFYTIWSYKKGAGKKLILESVDYLYKNCTNIKRFVTLSPQNEMARNFHLKNGAFLLNYNSNTVNYEYIV